MIIGRVRTVFGVQGWLKVESFTEPAENLLEYNEWYLKIGQQYEQVRVDQSKIRHRDLVVHLAGLDDRELARQYSRALICVPREELPQLDEGDYYWHQLEGLQVFQVDAAGAASQLLGEVAYLMETGANDVLVVKTDAAQGSDEILIPYLLDSVVRQVDLQQRRILVDWAEDWR